MNTKPNPLAPTTIACPTSAPDDECTTCHYPRYVREVKAKHCSHCLKEVEYLIYRRCWGTTCNEMIYPLCEGCCKEEKGPCDLRFCFFCWVQIRTAPNGIAHRHYTQY